MSKFFTGVDCSKMYRCFRCRESIPLDTSFFYKDSSTLTGFSYTCKKCSTILSRSRKFEKSPEYSKYVSWNANITKKHGRVVFYSASELFEFMKKPCLMCGGLSRTFLTIKEDLVPLCGLCKHGIKVSGSVEGYLDYCKEILQYRYRGEA